MGVEVDWGEEPPERTAAMEAETRRLTEALVRLGARRVILFGSRAEGKPRAHSDIDLIAVMPCDPTWTFARRLAEIGARIDPRHATDLLVYTPEEFEQLRRTSVLVREAIARGRVLFPAADETGEPEDDDGTEEGGR